MVQDAEPIIEDLDVVRPCINAHECSRGCRVQGPTAGFLKHRWKCIRRIPGQHWFSSSRVQERLAENMWKLAKITPLKSDNAER
jgi:hypothetical protein